MPEHPPSRTPDAHRPPGRLLFVVLTFTRLRFPPNAVPAVVTVLTRWRDSWASLGRIATSLARQGYDFQFTRYGDEGWRATFYPAGRAHSLPAGTAWEPTPWRAVQGAAWEVLRKGLTA